MIANHTMSHIAVFKSITETHSFCSLLRAKNIRACVQETPREANVSCGQCVMFESRAFAHAKELIGVFCPATFVGFLQVDCRNWKFVNN